MAATAKPKRKEHKKIISNERKLHKEVLSPHSGVRAVAKKNAVKNAKKQHLKKSFVKATKSMF